jgi:hypothetical protein|eukprot:m.429135 g.429135  ORF g.429135 m.429135 type:complete len:70 (-) comp72571_c0_seq1:251-460(-)
MTQDDFRIWQSLVTLAGDHFDGHLTVMKFTTNWRVGFVTPVDRDDIAKLPEGATFSEAATKAIAASGQV